MWGQLWNEFNNRAAQLTAPGADWVNVDAVDKTIIWQLVGHTCYVATPIVGIQLHLPELYSGAPWSVAPPRRRWIAFVTLNPSIDPDEIFPRRGDIADFHDPVEINHWSTFFNERFCTPPIGHPIQHGRQARPNGTHPPTVWTGDRNHPVPNDQPTWRKIETTLRQCLQGTELEHQPDLLGTIAAVVDAVPWKFASWGCVPNQLKQELLLAGSDFLMGTLIHGRPSAIITCGADLSFVALSRLGQNVHGLQGDGSAPIKGVWNVPIAGVDVPCFNVPAPTAPPGNAFGTAMHARRPTILEALGLG